VDECKPLRTGFNFDPESTLLDPFYSPPENFIMPERMPAPPAFPPLTASLSPIVWGATLPDLFDSFSAGLVLLQLCVPQLRGKRVMDPNGEAVQVEPMKSKSKAPGAEHLKL